MRKVNMITILTYVLTTFLLIDVLGLLEGDMFLVSITIWVGWIFGGIIILIDIINLERKEKLNYKLTTKKNP